MKIINLLGAALSAVMIWVAYYFTDLVAQIRGDYLMDMLFGYGDSGYNRAPGKTEEAAVTMLMFIIVFIIFLILNMKKVKTKAAKSIGMIGLIVSILMGAWAGLVIAEPGGMSFDEVGIAFLSYASLSLLFFIICLTQVGKAPAN